LHTCSRRSVGFRGLCISARKYENRNLLSRLRTALLELQAFQKLETAYTDALVAASADSTAKAAKLRIRKAVRDQGFDSPSPEAGEQRIANALKALDQT